MRRSIRPPPAFDNLRTFSAWWATEARTATCCYRASDEEIAASEDPTVFDCASCEVRQRCEDLWPENAEAWELYQVLCGRTVREARLESLVLTKWTEGWAWDAIRGLLDRLDILAAALEPHGRTEDQYRR